MTDLKNIRAHMEVIGADGVHVGTVDAVEGDRIKLVKRDSGSGHRGHHHYLSIGLVAGIEGDKVRLAASGGNAILFEEEADRAGVTDGGGAGPASAGWNWNKIGIGAAAIGVMGAATATVLARTRASTEDFELRLETDENVRLISSSKVEGTAVLARDGSGLGTIQNFMVDKYSGRVAYAVMSFGGLLGLGASLFPIPWAMLDYDVAADGYVLDVTREQLDRAPRFEASEAPEFDARYRSRILSFYRP